MTKRIKREMLSGGSSRTGTARPIPGVTADNYINLAENWTESTGHAIDYAKTDGKCFHIKPDMMQERRAWANYFRLKGMKINLEGRGVPREKVMTKWLAGKFPQRDGPSYAVPAQWPWQFDQSVSEEMCR